MLKQCTSGAAADIFLVAHPTPTPKTNNIFCWIAWIFVAPVPCLRIELCLQGNSRRCAAQIPTPTLQTRNILRGIGPRQWELTLKAMPHSYMPRIELRVGATLALRSSALIHT